MLEQTKSQILTKQQRWALRNPEKVRAYKKIYGRKYYLKNIEAKKLYSREYSARTFKDRWRSMRSEALNLLGSVCVRCSFSDVRALQIDHVNGGGNAENKRLGNGPRYLKTVIESIKSGSRKYQLLCANCNWIKMCENNERKIKNP